MKGNELRNTFQEMMAGIDPKYGLVKAAISLRPAFDEQLEHRIVARHLCNTNPEDLSLEHANNLKPDDIVAFKRVDVQDETLRKLKLGKCDTHIRLDLHNFTLEDAREELLAFLKQCQKMHIRTLIIVHGKGERSIPATSMKSFVCQWLEQIIDVQCFHSTQRHQGGTGAVYVQLKKSQQDKQDRKAEPQNPIE